MIALDETPWPAAHSQEWLCPPPPIFFCECVWDIVCLFHFFSTAILWPRQPFCYIGFVADPNPVVNKLDCDVSPAPSWSGFKLPSISWKASKSASGSRTQCIKKVDSLRSLRFPYWSVGFFVCFFSNTSSHSFISLNTLLQPVFSHPVLAGLFKGSWWHEVLIPCCQGWAVPVGTMGRGTHPNMWHFLLPYTAFQATFGSNLRFKSACDRVFLAVPRCMEWCKRINIFYNL